MPYLSAIIEMIINFHNYKQKSKFVYSLSTQLEGIKNFHCQEALLS